VKLFLAYPELGMMADDRTLYTTLRDANALDMVVQVHCENGAVIAELIAEQLRAGNVGVDGFAASRPPATEIEAVGRTLRLAGLARARVYLVHLSTAGAIELVRDARARGDRVVAEACTHHLTLDRSRYARADGDRALIVPPLRDRADVEALWTALADGTLDTVGSDHAQVGYQPPAAADFTGLPYAFPGVEVRLPLLLSAGRDRGISYERLAEVAATGPARAFGLWPRKGALIDGADADVVLWDPDAPWRIEAGELHDGWPHSPYAGLQVAGRIHAVYLRGSPLVVGGELTGAPRGRYVAGA
jgi:dihydropyrimidinase